jgi:hypothetical protein
MLCHANFNGVEIATACLLPVALSNTVSGKRGNGMAQKQNGGT